MNIEKSKEKILAVEHLTVQLDREIIIENLNFDVDPGEYLTIIGPNGSGKTTLFRALIGVIAYKGRVHWASGVVLGYVPQKLDIERNVPLSLQDFFESKVMYGTRSGFETYLDLVNLPTYLLKKPLGLLSGGEFQRALVAFALIGDANVLLFDEPTAGIDVGGEGTIYQLLHRLQDERGTTMLLISHDLNVVYQYADRVLCINKKMICAGAPREVLNPRDLAMLYGAGAFYHHHDNMAPALRK